MSDEPHQSSSGGLAFFATVIGCALFLGVLLFAYAKQFPRTPIGDGIHTPEQRAAILQKLHEREAKAAAGYDWVDKSKGVVRLPIVRAMQLTADDLAAAQK